MSPGDRHNLNGHEFFETLHGPMVWGTCADCARPTLVVGETFRYNASGLKEDTGGAAPARCSTCGRAHHGADLGYYGTGKGDLYGKVDSVEMERLRQAAQAEFLRHAKGGRP